MISPGPLCLIMSLIQDLYPTVHSIWLSCYHKINRCTEELSIVLPSSSCFFSFIYPQISLFRSSLHHPLGLSQPISTWSAKPVSAIFKIDPDVKISHDLHCVSTQVAVTSPFLNNRNSFLPIAQLPYSFIQSNPFKWWPIIRLLHWSLCNHFPSCWE